MMPAQNSQDEPQYGNFAPWGRTEGIENLLSLNKKYSWKILEKNYLNKSFILILSVTLTILRLKNKIIENVWEGLSL